MLLLVLGLLAGACSGTETQSGDQDDVTSTDSATGGDQGTADSEPLVVALPEEPRNLDPGSFGADVQPVQRNILEPLVDIGEDGLVPVLATDWERLSETEWLFHLREGVTFSNGTPFTAQEAADIINRTMDPDTAADALGAVSPMTASVQSEHELVMTAEEPNPILPTEMANLAIADPASIEGTTKAREPIGTGPYVLDTWESGSEIRLSRNDDYWGGAPEVENVRFVFRGESSVRADMVSGDEADIAALISPQHGDGDFEAAKVTTVETPFFRPDGVCPTTSDVRVRRAINRSIDREQIAEQLYGGAATPANMIITPGTAGYTDEIEVPPYDLEGAKELVEEAEADGADLSQEMTMMIRSDFPENSSELAQVMQAALAELGITANIQTMDQEPWAQEAKRVPIPEDRCAIILSSHGNGSGDSARTMNVYYRGGGEQVAVPDDQIDQMIDEALPLVPGPERQEALAEVFQYAAEELVPVIPVVHLEAIYAVSPDIDWTPRSDGKVFVKDVSVN